MSLEALWARYAATWSRDAAARDAELAACLTDDVTYCDPNGLIEGRAALSSYMGRFQQSLPGGVFRIAGTLNHHDRVLAHWTLHGPGGETIQRGTSFAFVAADGRLRAITGFFHPAGAAAPA